MQIVILVETAQLAKAPIQAVGDRISSVFVPTVVVLAIAVWLSWFFAGEPDNAAYRTSLPYQ